VQAEGSSARGLPSRDPLDDNLPSFGKNDKPQTVRQALSKTDHDTPAQQQTKTNHHDSHNIHSKPSEPDLVIQHADRAAAGCGSGGKGAIVPVNFISHSTDNLTLN
jgi:hypothetical protein